MVRCLTKTAMRKPYVPEERLYPDTPYGICPSVTTVGKIVAKPGLTPWAVKIAVEYLRPQIGNGEYFENADDYIKEAKKEPDRVAKRAAEDGEIFHGYVLEVLDFELKNPDVFRSIQVPERFKEAWYSFGRWRIENSLKPIALEQRVWHSSRFAGRLDFYGEVGGKLVVNDWKFANGIYQSHLMQSAAYSVAWEEMTGNKVDAVAVTRLDPKSGELEYHELTLAERDIEFDKFQHLLSYWWISNESRIAELEAKREQEKGTLGI